MNDRGSGGLTGGRRQGDDAHDVALLHDEEILAIDANLGARPLAEQNPIAGLHFERDDLATLIASTRPGGDDLAFLRLFLRGIRNDDAALCLFFRIDTTDYDAVMQWTKFHECPPGLMADGRLGALISTPFTTVLSRRLMLARRETQAVALVPGGEGSRKSPRKAAIENQN